jgi:DNA-binding transcriptional MerR regulator
MIRSFSSNLLQLGERLLERSLSQDAVEDYLQAAAKSVRQVLDESEAGESAWGADGILALKLIGDLGLHSDVPPESNSGETQVYDQQQIENWRQQLREGNPIRREGITVGTMPMLLALFIENGSESDQELRLVIEALLRHVELRRERALELSPPGSRESQWAERHYAAILLARAASAYQAPRYLNAALKLNDLAWQTHRRFRPDQIHMLYLRALAEVEVALRKVAA